MNKIVLHIGMPKTGTTTLQAEVFPFIAGKSEFSYLGLWQPHRRRKQHELVSRMHSWFARGEALVELRALIAKSVEECPIIISNEMILSSSIDSDWKSRIRRVAEVMDGYPVSIYLTVREPASAMFSYFVEHYLDAPTGHFKSFADAIERDPRLSIYRYAASIPEITSAFGREPIVEAYEDVFAGRSAFLGALVSDGCPFPNSVGHHNEKDVKDGDVLTGRRSTLRDGLRQVVYQTPLGRSAVARRFVSRLEPLTRNLDKVKFKPARVPRPTPQQLEDLRQVLRADLAFLRQEYEIDFESVETNRAAGS